MQNHVVKNRLIELVQLDINMISLLGNQDFPNGSMWNVSKELNAVRDKELRVEYFYPELDMWQYHRLTNQLVSIVWNFSLNIINNIQKDLYEM